MRNSILPAILGAICLVLFSMPAHALPTRTWVSGTGLDTNPCSRTQPCLTFAGAIAKTAAGGEIDCLDAGGFGAVTINQAIKIKCGQNGVGGVLVSGSDAIDINAGANDVVYLEGLDINGAGSGLNGITFTSGKALHVSNCVISDFTGIGINFAPNDAATLVVQDSKVVDNTAGGIQIAPHVPTPANPGPPIPGHATITNTHMDRNQFGLKTRDGGVAVVSNSTAANNTNHGFIAAGGGLEEAIMYVSHSLSTGNGISGIAASGSGNVVVFDVAMFLNGTGFFITGDGIIDTTLPGTSLNRDGGTPNGGGFTLQ